MSDYLLLGPVSFRELELPGRIEFGGRQQLAIHRLPGGARVIDAMGRDDTAVTWSGIFSGSDAAERARLLDLLRAEGMVVPLAWDAFSYLVVIEHFAAAYERTNWVPYRISCAVLADQAQAAAVVASSLVSGVLSDVTAASSAIDTSSLQAALAAPGAGSAGTAAYTAVTTALENARANVAAYMKRTGDTLLAAADPVAAGAAAGQLAQLSDAYGYLGRATVNLTNASV